MKKVSIILAIVAISLASCDKEDIQSNKNQEENVTIKAVIDPEFATLVKSDYAISGSTATFSWTSGDKFLRLVRAHTGETWGNYNHYTYYIGTIDGASASFSGTPVGSGFDDSGYALYPATLSNGTFFSEENQSSLYLDLNESTIYNASQPLQNIVPMVGKLSGDSYTFMPIMGVLAISISNIPAAANNVVLSTEDEGKGLSGWSILLTSKGADYKTGIEGLIGPGSVGLRNTWYSDATYSKKTKAFTFDAGSISTATFYFAAPVGDYNTLTITVNNDDTPLKAFSTSTTVTSTRGKITRLTAIDYNSK